MAFRLGLQRNLQGKVDGCLHTVRRFTHAYALPPSFGNSIDPISSPPLILPEDDTNSVHGGGFMDLMAVPKKKAGFVVNAASYKIVMSLFNKLFMLFVEDNVDRMTGVSKYKRGIRNGPKALKPTPVIVRCKGCGRVKLPHFYCCSGRSEDSGERSDAIN
uniref:Large ribosomal subunit protein bL32m n=1 Tax=Chenopodium quinoa TaxID=63459 RepID=A0A803MMV9_CHEQI